MSDTAGVIQSTIDKVLERVDQLAAKLGIAAKEIWRFSVSAKVVEAKRDLAKSAALILITFIAWGWAGHVACMKIPHDIQQESDHYAWAPCLQIPTTNGKGQIVGYAMQCGDAQPTQKTTTVDKGLSDNGWILIISGIVAFIFGLFIAVWSIEGVLNAWASLHTADYDAYQSLLDDWRD
jgi:hypothetical protein